MQDHQQALKGWRDAEGRPFRVPPTWRPPRVWSLRGVARRGRRLTLDGLSAQVAEQQARWCGCGGTTAATRWDVDGLQAGLPDGWELRTQTAQDMAGPLPTGFQWRALPAGGAPPEPWTDQGPDPRGKIPTGRTFRLAVNTVSFFEYEISEAEGRPERRYGPLGPLVADMASLGVQIVRHPGRVQMMLDELLANPTTGSTVPIAVELADERALDAAVRGSPLLARLLELVAEIKAQDAQIQLIITLISLGGGSRTWTSSTGRSTVDIVEDGDTVATTYGLGLGLEWEPRWKDQRLPDDISGTEQPFNRATAEGAASLAEWDAGTLDPRNPAKRVFYRRVARSIGRWLQDHESELGDHIAGIEILNEAEIRHAILSGTDAYPDGAGWGRFYYYCASALREQCDWVPLWLPGIASYAPEVEEPTILGWGGKVVFLRDLLRELRRARVEDGERYDLDELVDGLDYHWYHRARTSKTELKDPGDRQLLLYLPLELAELRAILTEAGLQDAQLTVTETAVNVLCSEGGAGVAADGYTAGCEDAADDFRDPLPDYRPPWVECPAGRVLRLSGEAPANSFQGAMVWMRLAAAMVGGASVVGWHTHIALEPSEFFAGTGLRQDFHGASTGIEAAGARPSWFSLRFMSTLLSTVTAARLLWPDLPLDGREKFSAQTESGAWSSSQLVWVVELENATHFWTSFVVGAGRPLGLGSGGWWAYLLFIDGTPGVADPVEVPGCATVSLQGDIDTEVWQVPLAPASLFSGSGGPDHFPTELWTTDSPDRPPKRSARTWSQWSARVVLGDWPVLLLATAPLTVASVAVDGTT